MQVFASWNGLELKFWVFLNSGPAMSGWGRDSGTHSVKSAEPAVEDSRSHSDKDLDHSVERKRSTRALHFRSQSVSCLAELKILTGWQFLSMLIDRVSWTLGNRTGLARLGRLLVESRRYFRG